jgi:hypothetical protein
MGCSNKGNCSEVAEAHLFSFSMCRNSRTDMLFFIISHEFFQKNITVRLMRVGDVSIGCGLFESFLREKRCIFLVNAHDVIAEPVT